ncbi:MAG: 30S ribosomal protein S16 [Candidatus Binatia bacterium]
MAVTIRLTRRGARKRPFYRVVVADERSPRDGRYLAVLGTYNPLTDPAELNLDGEKISEWMKKGAKPSQTVASLMKKTGLTI